MALAGRAMTFPARFTSVSRYNRGHAMANAPSSFLRDFDGDGNRMGTAAALSDSTRTESVAEKG